MTKEERTAYNKIWWAKNKDKRQQYQKRWLENNKEYFKKWAKNNKERQRQQSKGYKAKRRKRDIRFRLNEIISSHISTSLKGRKGGRKWEDLVGYKMEELISHLEDQFEPWMSWDNYGEWHIDHKMPKSWFDYTTYEDTGFKKCWALENLRPLEAKTNIAKNNKYAD